VTKKIIVAIFYFSLIPASIFADPYHQLSEDPVQGHRIADGAVLPGCPLVEEYGLTNLKEGSLTALWSQEQSGTDLARNSVRSWGNSSRVKIGQMDSGFLLVNTPLRPRNFEDIEVPNNFDRKEHLHGTPVANLIAGSFPFGAGEKADITGVWSTTDGGIADVKGAHDFFTKLNPRLINISMTGGVAKDATLYKTFTVIRGAGNSFPKLVETVSDDSSIVVGSATHWGGPTTYTQEGKVDILVPIGREMLSGREPEAKFNGTSAATPMVTGSLANVLSIIPGLNTEALRALLKNSATPLPHTEKIKRNGAGLLNAFKMVEVAKRISGLSSEKQIAAVKDPENFEFPAQSSALLAEAKQGLKMGKKEGGEDGCKKQKDSFKKLRQAFLLSDERTAISSQVFKNSAELLGNIYEEMGFHANADFYFSLDPYKRAKLFEKYFAQPDIYSKLDAIRYAALLPDAAARFTKIADEIIHKPRTDESYKIMRTAVDAALNSPKAGSEFLMKAFTSGYPDGVIDRRLLEATELLENFLKYPKAKAKIIENLGDWGPQAENMAEVLFKDTYWGTRYEILEKSQTWDPPSLRLLKAGLNDSTPYMVYTAANRVAKNPVFAAALLHDALKSSNETIRNNMVRAMWDNQRIKAMDYRLLPEEDKKLLRQIAETDQSDTGKTAAQLIAAFQP
jgi:hypothetical protein